MSSKILGALLVTNLKKEEINQISLSSGELQITIFFKSPSQCFYGIHVDHNRQVLVGSYDWENEMSSIIRLSSKGKFLKKMYTQSNVWFLRITENVNYDIVNILCNTENKNIKKLLVLDSEGTFRFKYSGPTKMKNTFKPRDVFCSMRGQIFIADEGSKCIHLLDKDGTFLQFLPRANSGLEYPRRLALSDSGILSIGYSNGKIANAIFVFPDPVSFEVACEN